MSGASQEAVTIYTTKYCPYCVMAKRLLDSKAVAYDEVAVDSAPERRQEMMARSARRTVPQIFIGDTHVGGCDDLYALDAQGRLDALLAEQHQPG
ncbi:glutaredoxin 3 [bacterium]|nr:glutaredoxin 3 [bacterium]